VLFRSPRIDQGTVESYLNSIAGEINIQPVDRKVKVENDANEVVEEEGKDGRSLLITENAEQIKEQLESDNSFIPLNLMVIKTKAKQITNRVIVANWDKYIEVNITEQKMTAYEKGGNIVGNWAVTTGKRGFSTPTGTFLVYAKTAIQDYRGGTPGTADYYYLPNVKWSTWFNGSISIHEAYWRSSFGGGDYAWNGSHGCVNVPTDLAKYIYDWAPIGTPVIVRY